METGSYDIYLSLSCSVPNSCPASPSRHSGIHHYPGYTTPLRPNLHSNSVPSSNAITPPTPPSLAPSGTSLDNNQQRAANVTPTNFNVHQSSLSKNTISISPMGTVQQQPHLELQLPPDGSQPMLQLPQFNSQFAPGSGATFVPLQNSIHPASGAFDHLTLEDQKPDLNQLSNQHQSQNAIMYPSDDGMGSIPSGGNNIPQQGGAQVQCFCFNEIFHVLIAILQGNILLTSNIVSKMDSLYF